MYCFDYYMEGDFLLWSYLLGFLLASCTFIGMSFPSSEKFLLWFCGLWARNLLLFLLFLGLAFHRVPYLLYVLTYLDFFISRNFLVCVFKFWTVLYVSFTCLLVFLVFLDIFVCLFQFLFFFSSIPLRDLLISSSRTKFVLRLFSCTLSVWDYWGLAVLEWLGSGSGGDTNMPLLC